MKSPLKDLTRDFNCLNLLKQKMPAGSVIHSYLFYGGELEFGLSSDQRFVCAHTTKYVIYEFWNCVLKNPRHIYEIISAEAFSFENENMFAILQEQWPYYKDPYVRSALFFLLNRYSDEGLISTGKMEKNSLNPLCLATLRSFKAPNFHLQHDSESDTLANIKVATNADYILLPVGSFNYNLFDHGKNQGFEMENINHKELHAVLTTTLQDRKWALIYHYHPQVANLYQDYDLTLIDKHGRHTNSADNAKEIIIANF